MIEVIMGGSFMEEPIWILEEKSIKRCNPSDLSISSQLQMDIQAWDKEYQDTFDSHYPPDSKFPSSEAEAEHFARGVLLADQLQNELGENYIVTFEHTK